MPVYKFGIFSLGNLTPDPGPPPSQPITSNQTNGNQQVGDTFTVGTEVQQSIRILDDENNLFEDDTNTPQFLAEELTVGGITYPVGTQVQNEFTLVTDQLDENGDPIQIIVLRFQPPTGGLSTTAYTTTAPLPPGTVIDIEDELDRLTGTDAQEYPDFICFAAGTMIKTDKGETAIEKLVPGDLVATLDHGLMPIRWIGRRSIETSTLRDHPRLQPIRIRKDALGNGIPLRDLVVSPQHRILVRSNIVGRMFEREEVLVPAKHLLALPGVEIADDLASVTYVHLMCDTHEVIEADGAAAETLYAGTEAIKALSKDAQQELAEIFGDQPYLEQPKARPTASRKRSQTLIARHLKNDRPLVDSL